jgi:hypothetical protein
LYVHPYIYEFEFHFAKWSLSLSLNKYGYIMEMEYKTSHEKKMGDKYPQTTAECSSSTSDETWMERPFSLLITPRLLLHVFFFFFSFFYEDVAPLRRNCRVRASKNINRSWCRPFVLVVCDATTTNSNTRNMCADAYHYQCRQLGSQSFSSSRYIFKIKIKNSIYLSVGHIILFLSS